MFEFCPFGGICDRSRVAPRFALWLGTHRYLLRQTWKVVWKNSCLTYTSFEKPHTFHPSCLKNMVKKGISYWPEPNYIVRLDDPFTKYPLLLHVCLHTTLDPIVSKGWTFSWKKIAGRSPKIAGESRTWNGCWILFRASTHQGLYTTV